MQARKEISIAVFIGLLIGGIIIGGIYRAKTAIDKHLASNETSSNVPKESGSSAKVNDNSLPLEVTSPIDGAVVDSPKLTLTGTTKPDTYVTILTEKNEYILVPSDIGNFSQEITLVKGANTIVVATYTKEGDKTEKTINLVYTTAEL